MLYTSLTIKKENYNLAKFQATIQYYKYRYILILTKNNSIFKTLQLTLQNTGIENRILNHTITNRVTLPDMSLDSFLFS